VILRCKNQRSRAHYATHKIQSHWFCVTRSHSLIDGQVSEKGLDFLFALRQIVARFHAVEGNLALDPVENRSIWYGVVVEAQHLADLIQDRGF
jgi:hypothetical protein